MAYGWTDQDLATLLLMLTVLSDQNSRAIILQSAIADKGFLPDESPYTRQIVDLVDH